MNRMVYKKKKKKFHPFRTLFNLAIIAGVVYLAYKYITFENVEYIVQKISNIDASYGFTQSTVGEGEENPTTVEELKVPRSK